MKSHRSEETDGVGNGPLESGPGAVRYPAMEAAIEEFKRTVPDTKMGELFESCFSNTLSTTVSFEESDGRADTFVITGDIEAMWLRDSTAQVWCYLGLAAEDAQIKKMLGGVINRQTDCILIDPYANAFNREATGGHWQSDHTDMVMEVHERKWEVDSLCYTIRLAHGYWQATGDTSLFDGRWTRAMRTVVRTFREQQRKHGQHGPYLFQRSAREATDTLPIRGRGNPVVPVGMICSAFRPSDDATIFPFLIPSNIFAVVSLRQLAAILTAMNVELELAAECGQLAQEVESAVAEYGIQEHPKYGRIYAYEVDGYGGRVFMDDANVPSLLALPYLGCCAPDDPVYLATRRFVLSEDNPWFFKGQHGAGVGSPHTGYDKVWAIGITMRGLTSTDDQEILECLRLLEWSTAGTGYMHEGFDVDNPADFSREWFAWANSLFAELLLKIKRERPALLQQVAEAAGRLNPR